MPFMVCSVFLSLVEEVLFAPILYLGLGLAFRLCYGAGRPTAAITPLILSRAIKYSARRSLLH